MSNFRKVVYITGLAVITVISAGINGYAVGNLIAEILLNE